MPRVNRPWTAQDDLMLAKLFEEGLSQGQIGDRMGRSKGTIGVYVTRNGLKRAVQPFVRKGKGSGICVECGGRCDSDAATGLCVKCYRAAGCPTVEKEAPRSIQNIPPFGPISVPDGVSVYYVRRGSYRGEIAG